MKWILLVGMLLLFSVAVVADSTWIAGDEMVIDRFNDLHLWNVNPCIDQNIQVGEDVNLKVYALTCAYVKNPSGPFGRYQYRLRCDNIALKLSVWDPTEALVFDTGWVDYQANYRCIHSSCWDADPLHTRNVYFPSNAPSGVLDVATPYIKFANSYNGDVQYFAYVPPFTNTTKSGHLNATFNVNVTGSYVMKMYMRDTQNASVPISTQTINFTVVTEGVVSGQCNSTNEVGFQGTENPVTDIFGAWAALVWVVLMVIVGVGILIATKKNIKVGVGITIFAELIMLVMGTWLHIISPVYLLILGLLLVAVGTMVVKKVFFS